MKERRVDATLIVVSEGEGADSLRAASHGRPDVRILGYQPAEHLSNMLASADAVVVLLEPDAAKYSVPSKALSYLAAGRPIVALIPEANEAARDVVESGGFVGVPTTAGAHAASEWLERHASEPGAFERIGTRARALAERHFDIDSIADWFEAAMSDAVRASGASRSASGERATRPVAEGTSR